MEYVTVIIIGAGHAGLAMSRALSGRAIDHIVLDRGGPGHAWRTERWESLRMLTPNWANGLPGMPYAGDDPDGFMSAPTFADQLINYARVIAAPIRSGVTVQRVTRDANGFVVETDHGPLGAEVVVNASGATNRPNVPDLGRDLPASVHQITPNRYRNPEGLPPGDVLVVGASATGVQLAREIQLSGRQVTLAVGNHLRLPRAYRGRDIEYWLDRSGILDERAVDFEDLSRARHAPSPQLIGDGTVDLNALQSLGVEVVGRLAAVRDGTVLFSGGLNNFAVSADLKMHRTLDRIDDWIADSGLSSQLSAADRPDPTVVPEFPRLSMDLAHGSVRTIVWATGYSPDHSWLDVPVFDRRGRFRHDGGVCPVPGLYVVGLPILRRRRSHQISGAEADSRDLSELIAQHLDASRAA